MRRIRQHLTYANVMATIAVFIAISGGTAVALNGSNTVFTDDIADDTQPASGGNPAGGLVAADLRPNSVTASEVANPAIGSSEVAPEALIAADLSNNSVGTSEAANNSLTGTDINESTLQGVNAATVEGAVVCDGLVELSLGEQDVVCTAGPLSIRASCAGVLGGGGNVSAALQLENGADHSFYARTAPSAAENPDWNDSDANIFLVEAVTNNAIGDVSRGEFSAGAADGSQLAGEVAARVQRFNTFPATATCHLALGVIG